MCSKTVHLGDCLVFVHTRDKLSIMRHLTTLQGDKYVISLEEI